MANSRICAAPDCIKPARSQYCEMHRARLSRGGSLERRQPRQTLVQLLNGRTQIGDWTVLAEGEPYRRPTSDGQPHPGGVQRTALCRCCCGCLKDIPIHSLKRKQTHHCGCKMGQYIAARNITHGMSYTAEHRCWAKLKERCFNPNNKDWPNYGGRGITVCERWRDSFEAFYEDMGARPDGHSIDRINVNGNYEPGNCRWATPSEQMQNVRHNVMDDLDGSRVALREACRRLGIVDRYKTVHARMRRGMTFEEAVY